MENISLAILKLLDDKKRLQNKLAGLLYGSIEYRSVDDRKYIYVHYRDGGLARSKYAGEYNESLAKLINENSVVARGIKSEIRRIGRELAALGYQEMRLDASVKKCVDFAKSNLARTIYKQGILEGITATYADTETIIEGGKVNNLSADDVRKVVNLKHAWDFILDEDVITFPSDFSVLTTINRFIEEGFYYYAGSLRTTPVTIGGSSYIPPLPLEIDVKDEIRRILTGSDDYVEIAISILLYVMKAQLFIDGNKRTAVVFANHILISHGLGIVAIPDAEVSTFKKMLVKYYEGEDEHRIKTFLKDKCLILI